MLHVFARSTLHAASFCSWRPRRRWGVVHVETWQALHCSVVGAGGWNHHQTNPTLGTFEACIAELHTYDVVVHVLIFHVYSMSPETWAGRGLR